MQQLLYIIDSIVFVFVMIGISSFFYQKKWVNLETSRKIIHIGVSNWWLFMFFAFDQLIAAMIPPILFIVLNYVSYKKNIFTSMERKEDHSLGTIYFPISLLLMVIFSYTLSNPLIAGSGIFVLGYGDGLAAIFGKNYGKHKIYKNKTILGTSMMFITSFVMILFLASFILSTQNILVISFIVASVATLVELFSPKGLDNLTIPIMTSVLLYLLTYI